MLLDYPPETFAALVWLVHRELPAARKGLTAAPRRVYPLAMSSLSVAATAVQILNNALNVLKAVRERAQTSKDTDLKGLISTLYDSVLSLKESVMRLTDENAELRRRNAELEHPPEKREPELRPVGSANFYFDGNKGPCCQPCYDGKKILTVLGQPQDWNGGVRRRCQVCKQYFYEKPMEDQGPAFGVVSDPNGWMGR